MYRTKQNKRQRHYQIKKTGIKDEFIDRQILAIHYAMVDKLLKTPSLAEHYMQRLIEQKELGKIGYGEFITWYSLFELIDQTEIFKAGVLEDSAKMRRYRRRTPLVGLLSEEERQAALLKDAAGETDIQCYL